MNGELAAAFVLTTQVSTTLYLNAWPWKHTISCMHIMFNCVTFKTQANAEVVSIDSSAAEVDTLIHSSILFA